jgi:hypothetical protein
VAYLNPGLRHFHVLDKILSFDEAQHDAFHLHPPFILIGSAGSGKTVLALEKIKQFEGDVLYVTLSPYLAENARNLYYSFNYDNGRQTMAFLSFREHLETLHVPAGKPMTAHDFDRWFTRYVHSSRIRDSHKLYEEFNGVLTGSPLDKPIMPREEYLDLGIRRSIFVPDDRPAVYDLFRRYLDYLREAGFYDLNLVAHASVPLSRPAYDWVVVDEVQDFTNIQLHLILRSLRAWDRFILCGDSNQIVHPNFFSWTNVKTMFYEQRVSGSPAEIIRILHTNYRNSPDVTDLANRLLLVKNARFGSIDRESNYLVRCNSSAAGGVELLADDDATRRELNDKTRRSAKHAVLVMRSEDKTMARRLFQTPLLFSIQEAKGLEYENVILLNFASDNAEEFDEITDGVTADDLTKDLRYARAKDKADKSLEAYKFYINALYVATTRAIRNVYLVEKNTRHRLFRLLDLRTRQEALKLAEQKSSVEEWKEEARKLELQGKQEQADAIRSAILIAQPVPWRILTPESLEELKKEAFDPNRFNQQAKHLIFEYAVTYHVPWIFETLVGLKYNRARNPDNEESAVWQKHTRDFTEKSLHELKRKMGLYGVDFRNPMNQTPLMIAARWGRADILRHLLHEGARAGLRDNWGRTAFHLALREAYRSNEYARTRIGETYRELVSSSIKIKIDERMIKIDAKHMAFFLIHSMLAVLQDILRVKIRYRVPAFETGDFVHALAHFPEPVIPEYRRRRQYITSILAGNTIGRAEPRNMNLFVRVRHGFYILNPLMDIEVDDQWVNVYDLIPLEDLRKEKDNEPLQYFLKYLAQVKANLTRPIAATQPPTDAAVPGPGTTEPPAAPADRNTPS